MKYTTIIGVTAVSILLAGCGKKNDSPGSSSTPPTAQVDTVSSFTSTSAVRLPSDEEMKASTQFDVSQYAPSGEKSIHVPVTTNDVVLIKRPSGEEAVVQFTSIDSFTTNSVPLLASYRWRFRSASSRAIQSGAGQVRESYDRKPSADGKGFDIIPKADNDITVRAGDIWIEWSYGTESYGYLYYYVSRAKIQILRPDAFDQGL